MRHECRLSHRSETFPAQSGDRLRSVPRHPTPARRGFQGSPASPGQGSRTKVREEIIRSAKDPTDPENRKLGLGDAVARDYTRHPRTPRRASERQQPDVDNAAVGGHGSNRVDGMVKGRGLCAARRVRGGV